MQTAQTLSPSRDVVCSLFEGDYHLGVAVLMNSLLTAGFTGTFHLGYRACLPPWLDQLERVTGTDTFRIGNQASIIFELVDTTQHFANYKPLFLKRIFEADETVERVFYFDPDIVSLASWAFYRKWADFGVAICEETVNGTMPRDHPTRLMWIEMMQALGRGKPRRELSRYYNSGFIGVSRARRRFLDLWQFGLEQAEASGVAMDKFMPGNREMPFYATDQDALNLAAMYSEEELSTIGPEGMGFVGGGITMHHANQGTKPWRKSFIRESLSAKPPLIADRLYFRKADGPIFPFGSRELFFHKFAANVATAIGRFYSR